MIAPLAEWRPLDLLPGLYALVLAGLLLAALRRWYDALPWRLAAVFALVLLALFGPVLFAGRVLLPLDSLRLSAPFTALPPADPPGNPQVDLTQQIAPTLTAVRRALAAGRWPLWDPLVGPGIPLLADPQSQLLQPLVLLALPLPLVQAAGVTGFLRLLVPLVFMALLLRRQGMCGGAALCGSLAYGLGGFLLIWLGWPIVNAAALLPVVLYAVVRCDEGRCESFRAGLQSRPGALSVARPARRAPGRRADWLLLWLAVFALGVGGHPEVTLYAAALAGAFFLARLRRRPRGARAGFLARGMVAAALAAGAAAPVLLPMLDHLPKSERAAVLEAHFGPRGWRELRQELGDREARAGWRDLVAKRLLPIAAPNAYGNSRRGPFWGEINSNETATGFAGSATLLLALLALTGRPRFPQERLMRATLAASLLLLAQPPGFAALVYKLPLVGATAAHHNRRVALLVAFSLAYLAACTVERLQRGETARSRPLAVAWALLLGLTIAWGYVAHANPWDPTILGDFRRGWMWAQLAVVALAAVVLLAGPRRRWVCAALAAIVAVELLAAHGPENPPMPKHLAFPAPPPVAFLQRRLAAGERMVGFGPVFQPNLPSLYGLADVRLYNPFAPGAYRQFAHPLFRTPDWVIPELGRPRHPFYDLLGVRYVLTKPGVRLGWPLRRVFEDPAGWVYARRRPLPRLFLPAAAQVYPERYGQPWLEGNRNFAAKAIVDEAADADGYWQAARPADSQLELVTIEPARIVARAHLAEPRLLASSVYQDGHWRVLADGRPVRTVTTNGLFAGAWLPRGAREIVLLYRPRPFLAGCGLAALSIALLVAWAAPPPRGPGASNRQSDHGEGRERAGDQAW